jgi:hypothetical protein
MRQLLVLTLFMMISMVSGASAQTTGLTAAEVQGWCIANCEHHRFEEIAEGPYTAVHMTTGIAATLAVPEGISVDGWNCYQDFDAVGPIQWVGCEATFRRI